MVATNTSSTAYETEIQHWQQDMETRLRAEDSWLTLTGLYWLQPGVNTLGADPSSDVVLPAGEVPDALGVIEFADGQATLKITASELVTVNGEPTTEAELLDDHHINGPSVVKIGSVTFYVIRREQEYGVRVRDANNPARVNFAGRHWFPIAQAYQVDGVFLPHPEPRVMQTLNSTGRQISIVNPGRVEFTLNGQTLSLQAFEAGDHLLWFVFKDGTSGQTSYGAGRFLYADLSDDGVVTLDFNKAYHPPCAFTHFATCPLPPKDNWLPVEITAGERS